MYKSNILHDIRLAIALTGLLLAACSNPKIPESFDTSANLPDIYPDYTDVTVPVNIAPLTFMMDDEADAIVASFECDGASMVAGGQAVAPDESEWSDLMQKAAGKDVRVSVYAKNNGKWTKYKPFSITVSKDSIDPYISYRLISPSYVVYEELTINQRCLEDYSESVIYNNMLCSTDKDGQCINCHNYQNYNPQRMQFHARQNHGGTIVAYDGNVKKVNMKNDSLISAGVYPAWHPWLKMIVYSTNKTGQVFHTRNLNKIEVFDWASDLIAYDIDGNAVTSIENDPNEFEVFPAWAPDGKTLYYCSAHFEFPDTIGHDLQVIHRANEVKYNIYKKSFNPETMTFGPREMVFNADSLNMSATLPRVSPDGRYLMFTLGNYGCFHIWHHEADLWTIDLATGDTKPVREINSDNTESYHSWSSNSRWVVFSSRRDDGDYTRPFMAHVDANGKWGKPFELPQQDPQHHRAMLKSYNIPEFMKGPVSISPQEFAGVLKNDDVPPVVYKKSLAK